MPRRQTSPAREWLLVDQRLAGQVEPLVRRLPPGSGVLVLCHGMPKRQRTRLLRRLRSLARSRCLLVVDEARRGAARVHDPREIARARLAGTRLLLLSPMADTRSHPDWRPLPRMRAAALARLAPAPVLALGGMDRAKFARVEALGFDGWAGIDGWLARKPRT